MLAEQVRIDIKRDCRRGMPEPLADLDHVDVGIDQLAGVRVPQGMERDAVEPDTGSA